MTRILTCKVNGISTSQGFIYVDLNPSLSQKNQSRPWRTTIVTSLLFNNVHIPFQWVSSAVLMLAFSVYAKPMPGQCWRPIPSSNNLDHPHQQDVGVEIIVVVTRCLQTCVSRLASDNAFRCAGRDKLVFHARQACLRTTKTGNHPHPAPLTTKPHPPYMQFHWFGD